MPLELVDESEVKLHIKRDIKDEIKEEIKGEIKGEVKGTKGVINLVSKNDVANCERAGLGMTDNCTLCGMLNKEIFGRCKNKYLGV